MENEEIRSKLHAREWAMAWNGKTLTLCSIQGLFLVLNCMAIFRNQH